MKRLNYIIICLLLSVAVSAQTITQKGVAYQYNGKKQRTPLGNVTISYDTNKRSTVSDEQTGIFSLTLTGLKMGDRIGLVNVKKREMMVFNQHAVDEWSVRKEPLILILCNADEFERQKENLINIGRREAKKKYDRQKAELEAKLNASEIQRTEYESALDKAYEELERLQKNVGEYADLFARIDESEIDTLAQHAMELYHQGQVEEAIRLFEQGNYMEKLDKALQRSQQADELKVIAEQAKEQATQDSLKALQSLKAQIEANKLNNEWGKAGELLKGLADRLNTIDDNWNYAYFCQSQNIFKDAEVYYHRSLSLIENQKDKEDFDYLEQKAILLNNLANLYYKTQPLTEAEAAYKEVLKIRRRLAQSNPQAYEPGVATTLNNLAILYKNTERPSEAEAAYIEALEIRRRLAQANPQANEPDLAMTLNNLGLLYSDNQHPTESEVAYKEVFEIYRRLVQSNPQTYEPDLAVTLNNLGLLYSNTRRLTESEAAYKEALETYRRLVQSNPQAYEPYVATTLNNLASLYKDSKRPSEAEAAYKESLEIRRRLAQSYPQAYESGVAGTLNNLAILYIDTKRPTESEVACKEALEIFRRLAQSNPQAYESDLAGTLNNLGLLYYKTQRFSMGEAAFNESLEILRRLAQSNPQAHEPDLAKTLYNLANLFSDTLRLTEGESAFNESLEIFRRLAKSNPQVYESDMAVTLNTLGLLYYNTQRFSMGEAAYKEALEIRRRLAQATPQAYESGVAMTLNNLGLLYSATKRLTEGEAAYKEALEILRRLSQTNPQAYELDVADTQYNVGLLKIQEEKNDEAIPRFEKASELYKRITKTNPAYQLRCIGSLYWLSILYGSVSNHVRTYQTNKELLSILKELYVTDSLSYVEMYVNILGSQSFNAIFMKQYAEAEQCAREGLEVDSTKHLIATNLATSLLLQGKYGEAETIYKKYKDELKDSLLDVLFQFAEAGLIPKECEEDVEKIKRMLNEQ